VNGAKSDHAVFGWGGPGGRVYQKAYVECFCSPQNLKRWVARLHLDARHSIYEYMHLVWKGRVDPYADAVVLCMAYQSEGLRMVRSGLCSVCMCAG
jgi:hypothetical protein